MTDPITHSPSNYNPYLDDPDTSPVPGTDGSQTSPSETTEPVCSLESIDPAVAQLTSKYKLDVKGFLDAQQTPSVPQPDDPEVLKVQAKLQATQKAQEYAQLSQAAYSDTSEVPGWRRLNADELEAAGLDPKDFASSDSGFKAALFRNSDSGEFALAFTGTEQRDLRDWKDWGTNFNQGLGNLDPQYRQAVDLSIKVTDAVGSTTMVGHSLGGGLAAMAAIASRSEATTFDAAGVHANNLHYATTATEAEERYLPNGLELVLDRLSEARVRGDSSKHITNYSTSGEILTAAQTISPVPEAQGKMIKVPAVGDYGTVELHAVQHSIEGLRAREFRLQDQVSGR